MLPPGMVSWSPRRSSLRGDPPDDAGLAPSIDPFVAMTRRRAKVILTFTHKARRGIPRRHRPKARPIVHIGVSPSELDAPMTEPGTNEVFTIVSGSRLVHWKGFDCSSKALPVPSLGHGDARLLITGEGPFRSHLERIIGTLSVGDQCSCSVISHPLGRLSRRRQGRCLCAAYAQRWTAGSDPRGDVRRTAHPLPRSRFDSGNGPEGRGFRIPVQGRDQVVAGIARSLVWASITGRARAMGSRRASSHSSDMTGLASATRSTGSTERSRNDGHRDGPSHLEASFPRVVHQRSVGTRASLTRSTKG